VAYSYQVISISDISLYLAERLAMRPERVKMGAGTSGVFAAGGGTSADAEAARRRSGVEAVVAAVAPVAVVAAASIPCRCRRRRSVV